MWRHESWQQTTCRNPCQKSLARARVRSAPFPEIQHSCIYHPLDKVFAMEGVDTFSTVISYSLLKFADTTHRYSIYNFAARDMFSLHEASFEWIYRGAPRTQLLHLHTHFGRSSAEHRVCPDSVFKHSSETVSCAQCSISHSSHYVKVMLNSARIP